MKDRLVRVWVCLLLVLITVVMTGSFLKPDSTVAQTEAWSTPINISNTPGASRYPAVAVDAYGNVHVVWSEDLGGGSGHGDAVFHTMWDGTSWSNPNDILYLSGRLGHIPAIAADDTGSVYVTWMNGQSVLFSKAVGHVAWRATSWSSPPVISGPGWSYFSAVAVDSKNHIYIVWEESTDPADPKAPSEIFFVRSADGGRSWSTEVNISNSPQLTSRRADIAVDGRGKIHAVWGEVREDRGADLADEVYYSQSSDGGQSWSEPLNISNSPGPSGVPRVVVDAEDRVYVLWLDSSGLPPRDMGNIYLKWWNGAIWSEPVRLPNTEEEAARPTIAIDSGGIFHVVWAEGEGNDLEPGNDIYYSHSSDSGQSWSEPVNISNTSKGSHRPVIAISEGNKVHVVWYDGVGGSVGDPGDWDIYYTSLQTASPYQAPALPRVTATPAIPPAPSSLPGTETAVPPTTLPVGTPSSTPTSTQSTAPAGNWVGVGQEPMFPFAIAITSVVVLLGVVILVRLRQVK